MLVDSHCHLDYESLSDDLDGVVERAGRAGIGTMLIANRLPRLHHPVFAADRFDLSADDRFFLAILADAAFDRDAAGKALAALHPRAIIEVPA